MVGLSPAGVVQLLDPRLVDAIARVEDDHWWYVGRRRVLSAVIERLELAPSASILDAGCGSGGNLRMLSRHGHVSAFETDEAARAAANRRGVCDVIDGLLPDEVPFGDGAFDLVTVLDVLEHVERDADALVTVHRLLRPDGRAVITVPAYAFLWSRHDEMNRHYRRYTRAGLVRRIRRAGFIVDYATYFNSLLFVPIAVVRLLSRILPHGRGSDLEIGPSIVDGALAAVFSSERCLVPRFQLPFGVSILVVARRSPLAG